MGLGYGNVQLNIFPNAPRLSRRVWGKPAEFVFPPISPPELPLQEKFRVNREEFSLCEEKKEKGARRKISGPNSTCLCQPIAHVSRAALIDKAAFITSLAVLQSWRFSRCTLDNHTNMSRTWDPSRAAWIYPLRVCFLNCL